MEWFYEKHWAVNNLEDTARQFLDIECADLSDGTPALNLVSSANDKIYHVYDPGKKSTHKAISLNTFKDMKFDFLIASIPAHIPIYEKLIRSYQPQAKLIVQIGNNWGFESLRGYNVMASVQPASAPFNGVFYHQEFDLNIFNFTQNSKNKRVSSYINVLQGMRHGWEDFCLLENGLSNDFTFKSYGGQCRDGNFAGPDELSDSIKNDGIVFHVKDGGDGYGHIIHNSYACGRPAIIRKSYYKNQLAEKLFNNDNCIDIDSLGIDGAINRIKQVYHEPGALEKMSRLAHKAFHDAVDFQYDSEKVRSWLTTL